MAFSNKKSTTGKKKEAIMHIDKDQRKKLEMICKAEVKGFSGPKLFEAFTLFLDKLKHEDMRLYNKFRNQVPSGTKLGRMLDVTNPESEGTFTHFEELLNNFIKWYSGHWDNSVDSNGGKNSSFQNGFSEYVRNKIGKRAGWICCFPDQLSITSGPVLSTTDDFIDVGKACLIYGVNPGDPRYDESQPPKHHDVENGIWLCVHHETIVNASVDYTGAHLQKWKDDHEQMIKANIDGKLKITFSFNPDDMHGAEVMELLDFVKSHSAFYGDYYSMSAAALQNEVNQLVSFMSQLAGRIHFGSKLEQLLYAMDFTCTAFLDICRLRGHEDKAIRESFASFRKIIGLSLSEMSDFYGVVIPQEFLPMMPHPRDGNSELAL
jgi:hypothetical protein